MVWHSVLLLDVKHFIRFLKQYFLSLHFFFKKNADIQNNIYEIFSYTEGIYMFFDNWKIVNIKGI